MGMERKGKIRSWLDKLATNGETSLFFDALTTRPELVEGRRRVPFQRPLCFRFEKQSRQ
jgi:hypothetical protein